MACVLQLVHRQAASLVKLNNNLQFHLVEFSYWFTNNITNSLPSVVIDIKQYKLDP